MNKEAENVEVPKTTTEKALQPNQVKLSDGRVVTMRESNGADELIVAGELGGLFTMDGAGGVLYVNAQICRTIIAIDDVPHVAPKGFEAVRDFMKGFKSKDWRKITALYNKLNGDDEEGNVVK